MPSPDWGGNGHLGGVAAIAPNDVWAVGDLNGGTTEHCNGMAWTEVVVPSPNGSKDFHMSDVTAVSSTHVWAAGYFGTVDGNRPLIEHWNGTKWKIISSPSRQGDDFLLSIEARSAKDIWAVGRVAFNDFDAATLTLHWDGSTWSEVPSPSVDNDDGFWGVAARAANDVWAVGDIKHLGNTKLSTLIEHWNGTAWSVVASPNGSEPSNRLFAVAAVSGSDAWAVGNTGSTSLSGLARKFADVF